MPTEAQLQTVSNAISSVRSAQADLLNASRATNDQAELSKISNEYGNLQSVLVQLIQAQVVTDDGLFAQAAAALNSEAAIVGAQAQAISDIVSDVQLAARIAGYITQAATFLASL